MSKELRGEVIFLNDTAGYGFIRPATRNESDIFFHVSEIPPGVRLESGDRVAYAAMPDHKKLGKVKATEVRLLERRRSVG